MANGLYTHYFKVSEFIRHNGIYNEYNRQVRITQQLRNTPQCVGDNTSVIRTYDPTVSEQMSNTLSSNSSTIQTNALTVPQYGLIKVYGKCPLTTKTTHLISASFSSVVLSGKSRDKLVMCCGEEDYAHASYQLREMLLRHQCCSSAWVSNLSIFHVQYCLPMHYCTDFCAIKSQRHAITIKTAIKFLIDG